MYACNYWGNILIRNEWIKADTGAEESLQTSSGTWFGVFIKIEILKVHNLKFIGK